MSHFGSAAPSPQMKKKKKMSLKTFPLFQKMLQNENLPLRTKKNLSVQTQFPPFKSELSGVEHNNYDWRKRKNIYKPGFFLFFLILKLTGYIIAYILVME